MGLWAGGLGDWARGGRWGEVALPTTGEAGLGCRVGSFWAMVSIAFGGSEVLVRAERIGTAGLNRRGLVEEGGWGYGLVDWGSSGVGDSRVGLSCLKILKSRRRHQMILWR